MTKPDNECMGRCNMGGFGSSAPCNGPVCSGNTVISKIEPVRRRKSGTFVLALLVIAGAFIVKAVLS